MQFRTLFRLAPFGLAIAACSRDPGPFLAPQVPLAYVRWVNAVPDTGVLDFRFVDQLDDSPWYGELAFRSMSNYQGAAAGARHIRVFPGGTTDINVVSQIVLDTTLNLEAGTYYTLVQTGYARAGSVPKQHFVVMEDPRPTPATNQIAARVINTMVGSTIDVYSVATGANGTTASGAALFSGIGYASASPFANLPTDTLAFRVTAGGSATVMAQALAPAGHPPASISQTAQGGFSVGGSLLDAFIFAPSVVGSQAPQTSAFKTAGVVWMQDNQPGT